MDKGEVDRQLSTSWELPEIVKRLKAVTEEIDKCIPGNRTKELMYELVEIVMECGERVHALEARIITGSPIENSFQKSARLRIESMKDRRRKQP